MTSPLRLVTLLALLAIGSSAAAAEPASTEGRVVAVTVYQGQALVTREVEVPQADGLLEVVVTNLPESVLPGSLFAEPIDGGQIRSVRYRARPIEEDVRKEVRELDDKILALQNKVEGVTRERDVLNQRKQYLGALEQFSSSASHEELNHGILDAKTLVELTKFLTSEREEIAHRDLELAQEERAVNKELELANRKRETVASSSARTVHEAVVFLAAPKAGPAKLRLSYLVQNATWSPSYNVRASDKRDDVTVEYNASVEQMSGEDWNDVEMTLSTATPSLVAKAPTLEALAIKLGAPTPPLQTTSSPAADYLQVQQNLAMLGRMRGNANAPASEDERLEDKGAESALAAGGYGGGGGRAGGVGSWDFAAASARRTDEGLNDAARQLQLLDYNNSLAELKSKSEAPGSPDEGVSVSYKLENATSLPSRADRQLIQIASVALKGEFYRLATPVLTNFVYEEARLANTSQQVFLAGPVATFLGGQFVGRGEMPTVAVGENFTVGLGIDSSLRATRELVDKKEEIRGGNRVVDFTYEIALENFGPAAAKVRILDRRPTIGDDDIKVTIDKTDEPLCDDVSYRMTDYKDGILRWDVEIPAQAVGPKHKSLRYTMRIEYDKQLSIIGLPTKK